MQEAAQEEAPELPAQNVLPFLPSSGSSKSLGGESAGQVSRGSSAKSLKADSTKQSFAPLGKSDLDTLKQCPTSGALITYDPKPAYDFDSSDEEEVPLKNKRSEPTRQLGVQGDHAKRLDMEEDAWGLSDLASVPASKMMTHRVTRGGSDISSVLSGKHTVSNTLSNRSRPSTTIGSVRPGSLPGSRALTTPGSVHSGLSRHTAISSSSSFSRHTAASAVSTVATDAERQRHVTTAAARACGFQEQKQAPSRHSSLPKTAYNWTGASAEHMCLSQAPSRLVARAVDAAKRHVPTEDRTDFLAFRSRMSEKEKDLDSTMANHGAHVIAAYDARIEGGLPVAASMVKEIFDYFCGMRGVGLGMGIPELGNGLMVLPEYTKLIRDMLPNSRASSLSGTTLANLFTHSARLEGPCPVEWDKKAWGNEPSSEAKKVKLSEWLCLMVRVAVVAYHSEESPQDAVRAMAADFKFSEGMKALRKRLEEYQRSGGGWGDGWVDDRVPESQLNQPQSQLNQAPPKLARAGTAKGAGSCRKFEDQIGAIDSDPEEMRRCVALFLSLGSDASAIPWVMFPGPYVAMVVPLTGHVTAGSDIMKSRDGPPPHKFQVAVKNVSDVTRQFFLGLEDLPMMSYLYTPKVQINGDHIDDFKKAKNNFVAPGSSMNFLLCAHVPDAGSFQGKITVRDSENGKPFFTLPVFLRVVPPERVARARAPDPPPQSVPEPVTFPFPEITWEPEPEPPAPKQPHRVFDRVSGTYLPHKPVSRPGAMATREPRAASATRDEVQVEQRPATGQPGSSPRAVKKPKSSMAQGRRARNLNARKGHVVLMAEGEAVA